MILLIRLQASACNFTKSVIPPPWVIFTFLTCLNGTKSRKASQILPEQICQKYRIFFKYLLNYDSNGRLSAKIP